MTDERDQSGVILVAEDNKRSFSSSRPASKSAVLETNCVLSTMASRLEFIDQCDADETVPPPALVLLDLNLPKIDSQEILDRLRSSVRCRQMPAIIMTSSDSPRDREGAAELGAYAYFHKPAELDDFMRLGELV